MHLRQNHHDLRSEGGQRGRPPEFNLFTPPTLPTLPTLLALPTLLIVAATLVATAPAAAGGFSCDVGPRTTNYYEVLMDTDGNLATGGPVTVVQGAEAPHDEEGIDAIAYLETGCDAQGNWVARRSTLLTWSGSDFVSPGSQTLDYPVGLDLGPAGLDVVEWSVQRSALPACIPRALFHASTIGSVFNDYTATFSIGSACESAVEVPIGGSIARFLLAGALALLSLTAVRRLSGGGAGFALLLAVVGATTFATALWALPIMIDGDPSDWGATVPIVDDPAMDHSSSFESEDMQLCYVDEDFGLDRLSFRCDVTEARDVVPPPPP